MFFIFLQILLFERHKQNIWQNMTNLVANSTQIMKPIISILAIILWYNCFCWNYTAFGHEWAIAKKEREIMQHE